MAAAVGAFLDTRTDLAQAAATIAHLLDEVGEQQARRGSDAADLAAAFQAAQTAAQKGLNLAVGDLVTADELVLLREDLATYLIELHVHAHASLLRAQQLQEMTSRQRRARLGAVLFGPDHADDIQRLASWEDIDASQRVIAVVSVSAAIPLALRRHKQTLTGSSVREVLVPASWDASRLATQLSGQAIMCPAVPLTHSAEAVALARQAADLLREGTVTDSRLIVPGADLLGTLLVESNPLLAELIVGKHLSALEAMSVPRRVTLGELALGSLESGQPIDQVARQLGIPRQTAHSRMKAIRTILGDALHDPTQRLELLVALRAALPRWRLQLTAQSDA